MPALSHPMEGPARALAAQGRGGDTHLAHITPREMDILMELGAAGTINPVTGLREFRVGGGPGEPGGVSDSDAGPGGGAASGPGGGGGPGGGQGGRGGLDGRGTGARGSSVGSSRGGNPAGRGRGGDGRGTASGKGRGSASKSGGKRGGGGIASSAPNATPSLGDINATSLGQSASVGLSKPQVGTQQFGRAVALGRVNAMNNPVAGAVVGALGKGVIGAAVPGFGPALGIANAVAGRPQAGLAGALGIGGEPPSPNSALGGRSRGGNNASNGDPGGSGDRFFRGSGGALGGGQAVTTPPSVSSFEPIPLFDQYFYSDPFTGAAIPA